MNINAMVKSLMGGPAVAAGGIYLIAIAATSTEPSGNPTWTEINLGVAGSMAAGVLVSLACVAGGVLWFRYGLTLHRVFRDQNTTHAMPPNQASVLKKSDDR
jgi:hypothetical protein